MKYPAQDMDWGQAEVIDPPPTPVGTTPFIFMKTWEVFKAKWGLPNDYPTTAPAYSEARSQMAKALGLGQGGRKTKAPRSRKA